MDFELEIRRASLSGGGRRCFVVAGAGADGDGAVNRGVGDIVVITVLAALAALLVLYL